MSIPVTSVTGNHEILIALGANLPGPHGTPEITLKAARQALEKHFLILRTSQIWLTQPVPVSDQPWYRNAVINIATDLSADEIFSVLKQIEDDFGRIRIQKNEPRILDLDLIACRDEVISRDDLIVPHPRLHERAFVLLPLRDVAPHWTHPRTGKTVEQMIREMQPGQKAEAREAL